MDATFSFDSSYWTQFPLTYTILNTKHTETFTDTLGTGGLTSTMSSPPCPNHMYNIVNAADDTPADPDIFTLSGV